MPELFGTDGVRGVANRELTPDLALALGRAAGLVLAPGGGTLVVGRDTRLSGPMLEAALTAGLCSAGCDVELCGVIPTPAIAFIAAERGARPAAAISASHNPVADNGIKFFAPSGAKIGVDLEDEIERLMAESPPELPSGDEVGTVRGIEDAQERYVRHVSSTLDVSLSGLRVVLDCAFGAAWVAGPQAFEVAGAEVIAINAEPDGARINVDCGSTALAGLAKRVVAEDAHLGLAFDGDADRVLAVDEHGQEIDGDQLIGLLALQLSAASALTNNVVVTTVMSNLGLKRALNDRGIEVITTPVGDRLVAEAMLEQHCVLGGEQSGHIILSRFSPTGDGILAGLHVAGAVASTGEPLSRLAHVFEPFPQVLVNVRVARKEHLRDSARLWEEVETAQRSLGDNGRVLVRPSGTEPIVRVMVEAVDRARAQELADHLVGVVHRDLG